MTGKTLILALLLAGIGKMLFAQDGSAIKPAALPHGKYGGAYPNQKLSVTGGQPSYTFSVSSGNLPPGITLSSAGVLSGNPTAAGVYSFTVKADGTGPGPKHGDGSSSVSLKYTLTIDPATLTVTANNGSMTYGGTVPALSATLTGFVPGDNAAGLKTQPAITTTASSASPVGTYPITASGASDPNYAFTYRAATMTVKQATLTITADNKTMPPGGPLPTLTATYAGFVNRDNASSLSTAPAMVTTATLSSPPGNYPITVSGAKDPNYTIVYVPGTLAIDVATLQVTANAEAKEYGDPDPVLTYTVSGLPPGTNADILTGSLSRTPGENVGTYPITIGSLSAGGSYRISFTGSNLTISKASQQIAWSQNLAVGCSGTTQVQLTATTNSGLPVAYSISDGNVATISGNVLTLLNPGTATVTAVQPGNANYGAAPAVTNTVSFQPASLITQHWNDVIIFNNSSGDYIAWQWYKDGVAVPGDTTAYYSEEPSLDGQYFVIATNKDGQQIQSCTLTADAGAAIAGGIKVFPNPAAKGVMATVVSNYDPATLQGAILQIADIRGRVLQQVTPVQPSIQITVPAVSGIYIVNLLLSNGQKASTNILVGK